MNLEFLMTLLTTASFALIWYVQWISYPLFLHVGESNWNVYHEQHTRRITWIMGPLMMAQLLTSAFLTMQSQYLDLIMVIGVFLLTFLWAVPLHNQLSEKYDSILIQKLIKANLYRSVVWTLLWLICLERSL